MSQHLDEAIDIAHGNVPARNRVLVTFDDGYLDNYTVAFPILRSLGVQGVFFLPTAFVGTGELPWWDIIVECLGRRFSALSQVEGIGSGNTATPA
jgi:peptidoglycan/xylan/chitin deacetylase (PgdA/CDA1 family)